jgi:hydroxyacylglutathione hydrolase
VLGAVAPLPAYDLAKVTARLADPGFVVLDARSDRQAFATQHLKGSLHATAQGDFSGFAGSYLMPEDEIVLVVDAGAEAEGLGWQLRRIGFDHLLGWLPGSALAGADGGTVTGVPTLKFSGLEDLLLAHPRSLILDVRRAGEYAAGHLRGAVNIAHTRLRARSHELPKEAPVIVHCQSGGRAATAMAWLQREGRDVYYVNDSFQNAPAALRGVTE